MVHICNPLFRKTKILPAVSMSLLSAVNFVRTNCELSFFWMSFQSVSSPRIQGAAPINRAATIK